MLFLMIFLTKLRIMKVYGWLSILTAFTMDTSHAQLIATYCRPNQAPCLQVWDMSFYSKIINFTQKFSLILNFSHKLALIIYPKKGEFS
jgi:hypothetical protein